MTRHRCPSADARPLACLELAAAATQKRLFPCIGPVRHVVNKPKQESACSPVNRTFGPLLPSPG